MSTSNSQSLPVPSTLPPQSSTATNKAVTSVAPIPSSSPLPTAEPVYLYNVTTLAGSGSPAFVEGMGLAASLNYPSGVAIDSYGFIYVADYYNHRIRRISSLGDVTTFAGSGSPAFADGMGLAASFNYPPGVAVDSNGLIYVADFYNHRIRMITPSGNVTTHAASGSGVFADGMGLAASFNNPYGVAVDSNGSVYVADMYNHRIRKISSFGNVTTLAGSGSAAFVDGMGLAAAFRYPAGVVVDSKSNGSIFVADCGNHRIRKITRMMA